MSMGNIIDIILMINALNEWCQYTKNILSQSNCILWNDIYLTLSLLDAKQTKLKTFQTNMIDTLFELDRLKCSQYWNWPQTKIHGQNDIQLILEGKFQL